MSNPFFPKVPKNLFQSLKKSFTSPKSSHSTIVSRLCLVKGRQPPSHRPYDCTIELLPGTSPPKGCIFSLSSPQRAAMYAYKQEYHHHTWPTSPAGAGFFFVVKKMEGSGHALIIGALKL